MTDEQPEPTVEPINFTQHVVLTVPSWPARTSFGERLLTHPHQYHATVDGDTVAFDVFNGASVYVLRRDLPLDGENVVADLVTDSDKITRRRP
jgi:hypothetical protein